MNKTITTKHPEIGYTNNVEVVEQALRHHFGFDDKSHVLTAVAAYICGTGSDTKTWGANEVQAALAAVTARVALMQAKFVLTGGLG